MLELSQPRLRLYTKPMHYLRILRHLVAPYPGYWVRRAESSMEAHTGRRHAVAVSMGRSAIYEGLRALLPRGGEVIVSPLTVPEVITMVVLAGCRPVFCDTLDGTWNLDPDKLEELVTPDTRAVITTHLFGITESLAEVQRFCARHGLHCIEDAAQALGARAVRDSSAPPPVFSIYSFSYPKNCSTFFGGMLTTDDDELARQVRGAVAAYPAVVTSRYLKKALSSLAKDIATSPVLYNVCVAPVVRWAYEHDVEFVKGFVEVDLGPGSYDGFPQKYAVRFTSLQGRLFCAKFPEVDSDTRLRVSSAAAYDAGLRDLRDMGGLTLPPLDRTLRHSYLYYPVQVQDAKALQLELLRRGRDISTMYIPDCSSLEAFCEYARPCPAAARTAANTLMLPTYPSYRHDQIRKNIDALRERLTAV